MLSSRKALTYRAVRIGGVARGGLLLLSSAYLFLLRQMQLRWGASDDEVAGVLPGDDLVPNADLTATRGTTIHRSAASTVMTRSQIWWAATCTAPTASCRSGKRFG